MSSELEMSELASLDFESPWYLGHIFARLSFGVACGSLHFNDSVLPMNMHSRNDPC